MKTELRNIWENYNRTRIAGDKKTANKLLQEYIGLLKSESSFSREEFDEKICNEILEADNCIIDNNGTEVSDKEYRIQHPLFKEIILPVLIEKYKTNSARHIKWIGQLEQFFYSDFQASKRLLDAIGIDGHFSTSFFLEKSFSIEQSQKTLHLILDRMARDFDYYTHEIPFGVLIEPTVFDRELKLFESYYEQSDSKSDWTLNLNKWRTVALLWRAYFSSKNEYVNFEDYLNKNEIRIE
jgi:hypothetical protein